MLNVTKVHFSGRSATAAPLYQYDYGQKLAFCGLDLPATYEVHFAVEGASETVTVLGDDTGVLIPDEYLQTGKQIFAWLFLHEGEDDGATEYKVTIPVLTRPEPSETQPTPVQQDVITQAIAALQAETGRAETAAENAETSAGNAEASAQRAEEAAASIDEEMIAEAVADYLDDHPVTVEELDPTVPAWAKQPTKPTYTAAEVGAVSTAGLPDAIDTALAQAKASGEFDGPQGEKGDKGDKGDTGAKGDKGDTGATGPQGPKGDTGETGATGPKGDTGERGPKGDTGTNGTNGHSPVVTASKTGKVTTVSVDGTPIATINDGEDGATPVKGTDYWTAQDKADIVQDVLGSQEIADMQDDIDGKLDAPSTAGTAGQVLGLDSNLAPAWTNQSGGGGGGTLEQICKITTTEEVTEIVHTLSNSGTFSELYTWVHTVPSANTGSTRAIMLGINQSSAYDGWAKHGSVTTNQYQNSVGRIKFMPDGALSRILSSNSAGSPNVADGTTNTQSLKTNITSETTITKLYLSCQNNTGVFGIGTEFFVWGVRS